MIKLQTTFWSKEIIQFDKILLIHYKTKEIIFSSGSKKHELRRFFKLVANFSTSKKNLQTYWSNDNQDHYQFATIHEGEITPIIWFDILINGVEFKHDLAFSTPMIFKNNSQLPFGRFPLSKKYDNRKLPIYREFKMKKKVYKFIANQLA